MEYKRVVSVELAERVVASAAADDHYIFPPTHFWESGGQIQGAFSNGIVPVGHFWMRKGSTPRQSLEAIKMCLGFAKARCNLGVVACQPTSPFYKLLTGHFKWPIVAENLTLFDVTKDL